MQYPPHPSLRFSDLGLPSSKSRLEAIAESRSIVKFFNARAALFHVFLQLKTTRRSRVLMPAFHCVSMVEPAICAGLTVSYYRIDRHLQIDVQDVLAQAGEDVCGFVFVDFFGFAANVDVLLPELRRRGVAVIEDRSHSFLQSRPFGLAGGRGDFTVYSFAKLVPCGVGGGLRIQDRPFALPALHRPALGDSLVRNKRLLEQTILSASTRSPARRAYVALEAARVRRRRRVTARRQTPGEAQGQIGKGEATHDFGDLGFNVSHAWTRMPALPRWVLGAADLPSIVAARRRNYQIYVEILGAPEAPPSIFPQLDDAVCPWAYPIIVADRAQHDQRLRSRGVPVWTFGDLLHPDLERVATRAALEDARHLSKQVLCLPVHQGLPPEIVAGFARTVAAAGLSTTAS